MFTDARQVSASLITQCLAKARLSQSISYQISTVHLPAFNATLRCEPLPHTLNVGSVLHVLYTHKLCDVAEPSRRRSSMLSPYAKRC